MKGLINRHNGAYYGYDATGERSLKLTGQTIHVNQNGQDYHIPVFDKQTLYASPLITINDKGYTKHYFEEGKRICSKIGSGELRDINDLVGHMEMNYEEQLTTQYEGIKGGSMSCFGGGWFDLENNNLYKSIIQPYENPINPDEPIFYYHSDHLGSASFLTDRDGYETQQLVYLPFGEDWVDMKYNTSQYDTPYKFNGKEKDEETGYNYYGARYYYDWASIWLSVDPLSDKYPHLTSYNYCANNPVMLIDPDGREIGDPLKNMKVRRLSLSHTFGLVRRYSDGSPKNHQGVDYHASPGTDVYAAFTGLVKQVNNEDKGDYGKFIVIQHYNSEGKPKVDDNGNYEFSFYAHLSKINVKEGENVTENETIIGETGNTGNAKNLKGEDQHLHFEIREKETLGRGLKGRKDPNAYVDTKFEIDKDNNKKVNMLKLEE